RLLVAPRGRSFYVWLEGIAAAALIIVLVSSYLTLTGSSSSARLVPSGQAAAMLVGTLIPRLARVVLFGRRLAIRRAGGTTARLHVNLVFFFSLVAAIPTLFVAVFASYLFQAGVQFWFSDDNRGILESSNELAQGYYEDNQEAVGKIAIAMAGDLKFVMGRVPLASEEFIDECYLQVVARELNESAIQRLQADGTLTTEAIADPGEDTARERISP